MPRSTGFQRLIASAVLGCCALLVARLALAQGPAPDPTLWAPASGNYTMTESGGLLYVGGQFDYVGPRTGSFLVTDTTEGLVSSAWPAVNGPIGVLASDGFGGWYVAGWFNRVGEQPRNGFAHIRADRSVEPLAHTFTGDVLAMAARDGVVYVGGGFTQVDGQPRAGLAAFDISTGALKPWTATVTGQVNELSIAGGVIVVAGAFSSINGSSRQSLAQLDAETGALLGWAPSFSVSVDALALDQGRVYVAGAYYPPSGVREARLAAFDMMTGAATGWAPQVDDLVLTMATNAGRVFLGGQFLNVGGSPRPALAAVDGTTGGLEAWGAAFAPTHLPDAYNRVVVRALAVHAGQVYVGGDFTRIAGQRRGRTAAIDAVTGELLPWAPALARDATSIAPTSDGIGIAGHFASGGGVLRDNLAAIDLATGRPTEWAPSATQVSGYPQVQSIAVSRGKVYVGGLFNLMNGQSRPGFAVLDSATGGLRPLIPVGPMPTYGGQGWVGFLHPRGDTLIVGGNFSSLGGLTRNSLAAIDTRTDLVTSWDPHLVRTPGSPANGVRAIAGGGETIYVSIWGDSVGGRSKQNVLGLAALDPITGMARNWPVPFDGYSGNELSLAAAHGRVYVGGYLSVWAAEYRETLFALDSLTGEFSNWNPNSTRRRNMYETSALAVDAQTLYVAGGFSQLGGQPRAGFATLDASTGTAGPWNPGLPLSSMYADHLLLRDEYVYAAGQLVDGNLLNDVYLARYPKTLSAIPPSCEILAPGAGVFSVGSEMTVQWSAVDDRRVSSVDLRLSRNGPNGPWEPIALGLVNSGSYSWRVAGAECLDSGYLRLDARDDDGHVGSGVSPLPFSIGPMELDSPSSPAGSRWSLGSPIPNPSRVGVRIPFEVPLRSRVRITLADVQGREVARLADREFGPGSHSAALGATGLPPGLYLVRLRSRGTELRRKLIITR